jgi:transmembrane sensor
MDPEPNTIEAQANRWAVRLDAGPLAPEEQAELDGWMSRDRRHHGALVRARAIWLDADRLGALAAGAVREPDTSLARSKPPADEPGALTSQTARRLRAFLPAAGLIAASVVLALLAATYLYTKVFFSGETYTSEIGEVRNIGLPDGSGLTINTDTHARVQFEETERNVAVSRGEALFNVAHDARRPFIVHANGVKVKAVGTAFTVRVDDARVDVLVTEGVVEVSREGAAASVQRITANQRAVIASKDSRLDIETVDRDGVNRQLAWRQGMVAFAGEPLSVAVAEINRHSRHPIYVDDPELAAHPVVGIFHANDAEGFASAASATFGAEVVHAGDAIHLRAARR